MPRAKKQAPAEKPPLGLPDPLEAALETARNAQEGNRKLALSVDCMRTALETVATAEMDNRTKQPVTLQDMRGVALEALSEYSRLTGQNWRRAKLVGSWAGGTGNPPVWPEKEA